MNPTTTPSQTITPRQAQWRGSLYYGMIWGILALSTTFISIELNHRGVTTTQWGIISALRALVIFLVAPVITRQADLHRTRVKWLRWVMMAQAVIFLLYVLPKGENIFVPVLVIALLWAVAGSAMMPLGDGIIVRMAGKHHLEYGRMRLWGSLGFAISGTLGGLLWSHFGYSYIYYLGFIGYLIVSFFAARLEEPAAGSSSDEPATDRSASTGLSTAESADSSAFAEPAVIDAAIAEAAAPAKPPAITALLRKDTVLLLFLFAAFLRAAAELVFFSFAGIYIDQLTNNAFFAGLINGGAALPEIPVMIYAQRIIRRFGLAPVVLVGFAVQALGLGIFAFSQNPWIMFAASALRNMGFALYFVAAVQFIDLRAGKENATSYQGVLSAISWGLAPLVVTPLAGWLYQNLNAQSVFILSTVICTLSVLVMIPVTILVRKKAAA